MSDIRDKAPLILYCNMATTGFSLGLQCIYICSCQPPHLKTAMWKLRCYFQPVLQGMKGWMCGDEWGTKLCCNILSTVGPGIPFSPGSPFCPRGPGGPSVPLKPGGPGRPCKKDKRWNCHVTGHSYQHEKFGGLLHSFWTYFLWKSMDNGYLFFAKATDLDSTMSFLLNFNRPPLLLDLSKLFSQANHLEADMCIQLMQQKDKQLCSTICTRNYSSTILPSNTFPEVCTCTLYSWIKTFILQAV